MAKLNVAGRAFELAPYRLGALRQAAAYLDRVNARAGSIDTMEGMLESARDMCEVLAIGLKKIDPELDADWLEEQLGIEEMPELQDAFRKQLEDSGLVPKGEASAAPEQAQPEAALAEASPSSSDTSSPSS